MRTTLAFLWLLLAASRPVAVGGPDRLGAEISTADGGVSVGSFSGITRGIDGLALISYFDAAHGHLKVLHCSNISCSAATTATVDRDGLVGLDTSIAVGADGLGLISYLDYTHDHLKVAHCANVRCSQVTSATVDGAGAVGAFSSLTVGADGAVWSAISTTPTST